MTLILQGHEIAFPFFFPSLESLSVSCIQSAISLSFRVLSLGLIKNTIPRYLAEVVSAV